MTDAREGVMQHPSESLIGAPIERFEDLRFLRGKGQYVSDVILPEQAYAVILRSSIAHGRIVSIDTTHANALPGIIRVITAADLGDNIPKVPMRMEQRAEYKAFEQPALARTKVRYVGEPIAVVVAESQAIGEDALDAIAVDIEPLPAIVDRDDAVAGDVLLFEENGSNQPAKLTGLKGDADAIFATAPYTRREKFQVHRHSGIPMETRGIVADWDEDEQQLRFYGAIKMPFENRATLAQMMDVPEAAVTLIEKDNGGGFGIRGEFYPEDFLIPFASRLVRRPVKWLEDRREHFMAAHHAREAECEIEIACDEAGRMLALRASAWVNSGAYLSTSGAVQPRNIAQVGTGPYRIEHIKIDSNIYVSNKTPIGTYRGPGRFEADFFRERLIDLVAGDFGIDRVEFRRMNLIKPIDMPYPLATVMPTNIATETDSGDYAQTLARCLADFGWEARSARSGTQIDGRYHGIAVGCYIEGAGGGKEGARLTLEADGTVTVGVGSSAIGQGVETVFAQIAGDALDLPLERIRPIKHGSTDIVDEGVGAFSSRSTVMGGTAVMDAAAQLNLQIRESAARRLQCTTDAVELRDGAAHGPAGGVVTYAEVSGDVTPVEGRFVSTKRTYSYGAHAVEVAVDPGTGDVRVIDYIAVEDVGRIVNPITLHGQCVGSIVQGLGGAILEQFNYDGDGQLLTGSFADYLMPSATDFPSIHVVALEEHPCPNNPMGAKGAGEGGIIPTGGLIANAVADALAQFDIQPMALPLSPITIWRLLKDRHRTA